MTVDLTAPTVPGVYHLIAVFRAEFTAAQALSATNWALGGNIWNNGDDVSSWSLTMVERANGAGTVCAPYLPTPRYLPATAIEIVVE